MRVSRRPNVKGIAALLSGGSLDAKGFSERQAKHEEDLAAVVLRPDCCEYHKAQNRRILRLPEPVKSPILFGRGSGSSGSGPPPPPTAFVVTDGANNLLTTQLDAVNHWPDGSIRKGEILGYTSRTIPISGTDTLSLKLQAGSVLTTRTFTEKSGTATVPAGSPFRFGVAFRRGDVPVSTLFNNALPRSTRPLGGGTTPASLLLALQSFPGAQDLNVELSSITSATGASNIYTSGTWTAHFNALAAGPYVQQVNMGPCCMAFRAFGQLTNGGNNHPHLFLIFYVWLWLNPATGAIQDVEYIAYLGNSFLVQAPDGVLYSSFPPDRYNYNPAIKNGLAFIVTNSDPTMLLNPGSPGNIGGHYPRAGWFTARADGKPRWITGTLEAQNLQITLDPVQANPQTVTTARDYLTSTGLLPRYDAAMTDVPTPLNAGTCVYAPMMKGVYDSAIQPWNSGQIGINGPGNRLSLALMNGDEVFDFYVQTPQTQQNNRISALGCMTFPLIFFDVNGRIPNILGADVTGLTPHTRISNLDCTKSTEQSVDMESQNPIATGNWSLTTDTSHFFNFSYYPYLMEGGAHLRDCVIGLSYGTVFAYQDCDYNLNVAGRGFGTHHGSNRAPQAHSATWYGNKACNWSIDREEAWGTREIVLPAAILPDNLADGTAFGETIVFKTCCANTFGFAAAVINNDMGADQVALGAQFFAGGFAGSLSVPLPVTIGSDDPWMQAYLSQVWAIAARMHGGDATLNAGGTTLGAALSTCTAFNRRYHEGFINGRCSLMGFAQTMIITTGGSAFRTWATAGLFTQGTDTGGTGNCALWNDTQAGWVGFQSSDNKLGPAAWWNVPIDVGAKMFFTLDLFQNQFNDVAPPSPFTQETMYRVVAVDLPNRRVKLCLDSDNTNTVVIPSVTGGPTPAFVVQLAPVTGCPATYTDLSATPNVVIAYPSAGGGDQLHGVLLAIRSYRLALGDDAGSAAADAALTARNLAAMGGTWNRTFFASSPMSWIKYP